MWQRELRNNRRAFCGLTINRSLVALSSIAHSIGSVTIVIAAVEMANAAKLNVVPKTFRVVWVNSAANPSTMMANITTKAKIEYWATDQVLIWQRNLTKDDHSRNVEHDGYRSWRVLISVEKMKDLSLYVLFDPPYPISYPTPVTVAHWIKISNPYMVQLSTLWTNLRCRKFIWGVWGELESSGGQESQNPQNKHIMCKVAKSHGHQWAYLPPNYWVLIWRRCLDRLTKASSRALICVLIPQLLAASAWPTTVTWERISISWCQYYQWLPTIAEYK
jgi:hypothetical protein